MSISYKTIQKDSRQRLVERKNFKGTEPQQNFKGLKRHVAETRIKPEPCLRQIIKDKHGKIINIDREIINGDEEQNSLCNCNN